MSALYYRTPTGHQDIAVPIARADPVYEPFARYRRAASGRMRASYPGADPFARGWEFETPLLARATARQLEVLLSIPGTGSITGLVVDARTDVVATVLARSETGADAGYVTVRFRLEEIQPTSDARDLCLLDVGAGLGTGNIVSARASTATAIDEDGALVTFAIDATRVPHFATLED